MASIKDIDTVKEAINVITIQRFRKENKKMALFDPINAHHSFLAAAAAACSLNRSPFSISSLNHHSSLSKGPKLYACQSGPLSKDEVDDWHRMKCHLGILTRSWESECTMYLGQGICIK